METLREWARRARRLAEARRRALLLLAFVAFLLLYLAPAAIRFLRPRIPVSAPPEICIQSRLAAFKRAVDRGDAAASPSPFVPYVGNGAFGVAIEPEARVRVRSGRTLSLPVDFKPLVSVGGDLDAKESFVVDYSTGTVRVFRCFADGYDVSHEYYAHRTIPYLLVQVVKITNPTSETVELSVAPPRTGWSSPKRTVKYVSGSSVVYNYDVYSGSVDVDGPDDLVLAVCIATRVLPAKLTVRAHDTLTYEILTTIQYSDPVPRDRFAEERDSIERLGLKNTERAVESSVEGVRDSHVDVWKRLWLTGFSISESKASDAINGDRINATVYAVLSQVRSLEYEDGASPSRRSEIMRSLSYAEGCYGGYYTLQAENLWKPMENVKQLDNVVGAWLLTLEKQGCHNLLKAGASGAAQAMVLSFGGLRFSNQHLEFNVHPSDLHRDFHFRRVNYGNLTHLNISVIVEEDNKAALYVALDRSDKNYYACDGGCLDSPVPLGPARKYFPVKLTEPLTAILYITSDKQHMEDLRHAIHVKEVMVAPPHEHHVLALHKHGHSLGGLPTIFWVTVCFIIVVFHLFLCRIIMTEYCDPPDNKYRKMYSKPL